MAQDDERRERLYRWVQEKADRDHGGVWLDAAIELLDTVRTAEQNPDDLWAPLQAQQRARVKR